jgi:hypothetical protein
VTFCHAGFWPAEERSCVTVPGSLSLTRSIAPVPVEQLSDSRTASSPESGRQATSHARIAGATALGVPSCPFYHVAV